MIPLLVVSVLLWVTFIVEVVVSIPLVIVLEDKLSKIENRKLNEVHVYNLTESCMYVCMYVYRTLAKEGPLQNIGPPPTVASPGFEGGGC